VTEYLSLDIAEALLAVDGFTLRDRGLFESALYRPQAVAFGQELFTGLHAKAAALLDAINRAHALLDGNKRTAWTFTDTFYRINGYQIVADIDDAEAFALKVAADHLPLDEITAWLSEHCERI
jgi:death-on-curing protein